MLCVRADDVADDDDDVMVLLLYTMNTNTKKIATKYEKKTRKCEDREINNLNEWKTENNS